MLPISLFTTKGQTIFISTITNWIKSGKPVEIKPTGKDSLLYELCDHLHWDASVKAHANTFNKFYSEKSKEIMKKLKTDRKYKIFISNITNYFIVDACLCVCARVVRL